MNALAPPTGIPHLGSAVPDAARTGWRLSVADVQ